jgi:hypothetical protein
MEHGRRANKHCIIEKCEPSCEPKRCEKKHKKCSSSSSSSSCEDPCEKKCCCKAPKVVQSISEKCGTISLGLVGTVIGPELLPTYVCPGDVGADLILRFVVTNNSLTCSIKQTIYLYDSLTGVHKFPKSTLAPGGTNTLIVTYKIPASACAAGFTGIVSNSNAYINFNDKCNKCVILVSPPVPLTATIAPIP